MSTYTDSPIRNGVDTATLFATLDAVKGNTGHRQVPVPRQQQVDQRHPQPLDHPAASTAPSRRWSTTSVHVFDVDHPAVLVGADNGPTPVEYVLHALAACLTAGIANIAAARNVNLTRSSRPSRATSTCSASSASATSVRNGFQGIKVSFKLKGDDPEKLRKVVEQSTARSAVYDIVTNGVPVAIEVEAG